MGPTGARLAPRDRRNEKSPTGRGPGRQGQRFRRTTEFADVLTALFAGTMSVPARRTLFAADGRCYSHGPAPSRCARGQCCAAGTGAVESALSKAGWSAFGRLETLVGDVCRSHCWRLTTETATLRVFCAWRPDFGSARRHASVLPSPANLDQPPAGGEQGVDRAGCGGTQPRRAPGRCGPAGALRTFRARPARSSRAGTSAVHRTWAPPGLLDAPAGPRDGKSAGERARRCGAGLGPETTARCGITRSPRRRTS